MASEREERNSLVASMPPGLRAAYGAAQKASDDQLSQALELSTVELDVLWPAVQTDSKVQALFASAR